MTQNVQFEHEEMVKKLAKTGEQIRSEMTAENAYLLHMAVGIAGEAGELLDAIKKVAVYNKPVDLENIIEELGDLEFYMAGLRTGLHILREHTLAENMLKLRRRYPNYEYTDQRAQTRADKQ